MDSGPEDCAGGVTFSFESTGRGSHGDIARLSFHTPSAWDTVV